MATTITVVKARHSELDIENMVSKPAWKAILLDLIGSGSVDPWNVDIVAIADGYIRKIKEMKNVDLLVPANVILAASILLRYKSEYLRITEPALQDMEVLQETPREFSDAIPELSFVARVPPKRQITMHELLEEMEKVIKYEGSYRVIKHRGGIEGTISIKIDEEDIEKRMGSIHEMLKGMQDSEGLVLFSQIAGGKASREKIYVLLSLLHLTQKKQIDLRQDDIFGEIFIQVLPQSAGAK